MGSFAFIQLRATRVGYGSCWFRARHTQIPAPIWQSSAKPCGAMPSEWSLPFYFSPSTSFWKNKKTEQNGHKGGKQNIAPAERKSGRSNAQSRGRPAPPPPPPHLKCPPASSSPLLPLSPLLSHPLHLPEGGCDHLAKLRSRVPKEGQSRFRGPLVVKLQGCPAAGYP